MELYLMRHGLAEEQGSKYYPNDDRPLTDEGRDKLRASAKALKELVSGFDRILTSPLLRAHETAQLIARGFGVEERVEITPLLLPGFAKGKLLTTLEKESPDRSVLLVTHNPDVGIFASLLLGTAQYAIDFKKGSICRIQFDGVPVEGTGVLKWHLTQKQLGWMV